MANFEIENISVSAPTKWQARNEFEIIMDRKVFMSEIVRDNMDIQFFASFEDMKAGIPHTFF